MNKSASAGEIKQFIYLHCAGWRSENTIIRDTEGLSRYPAINLHCAVSAEIEVSPV